MEGSFEGVHDLQVLPSHRPFDVLLLAALSGPGIIARYGVKVQKLLRVVTGHGQVLWTCMSSPPVVIIELDYEGDARCVGECKAERGLFPFGERFLVFHTEAQGSLCG